MHVLGWLSQALSIARDLCSRRLWPAVGLGSVVLLSGCLLDVQFRTETPVFSVEEAVIPDGLAETYGIAEQGEREDAAYLRFTPVSAALFAAEAFLLPKGEGDLSEAIVAHYDGYFVPLAGGWHIFVQDDDKGQGNTLVGFDRGALTLVDILPLDTPTREGLAAARRIAMSGSTELVGTVSRDALRGFLDDVRRHAQAKASALPAVAGVPRNVEDAAYANTGPILAASPADEFTGGLDAESFVTLLRRLDEDGIAWGSYLLARLHANGWGVEPDDALARQYAERAVERGLERASNVLGVLALEGRGEPRDESKALALFRAAADAGEPRAMLTLSNLYFSGSILPEDPRLGFLWLEKAAEDGLPDAQFALARRLIDGDGVAQDDEAAVAWLRKADRHADAQAFLGWMYDRGRGVDADAVRASRLYLGAAERGQLWAQWQIGERLIAGTGIEPDPAAGLDWLRRAAQAGHEEAAKLLARHEAAGVVAGVDRAEAQEPEGLERACEGGSADACFELGVLYDEGRGVAQDPWLAGELFEQACEGGHREGCEHRIAQLEVELRALEQLQAEWIAYQENLESTESQWSKEDFLRLRQEALENERSSLEQMDVIVAEILKWQYTAESIAEEAVSRLTIDFDLAEKLVAAHEALLAGDLRHAAELFLQACEGGHAAACFDLGVMYAQGHGVARNDAEAVRWYGMAAEQGLAHAQFNLGVMYADGRGVERDDAEAVRWYRLAAEAGHEEAAKALARHEARADEAGSEEDRVRAAALAFLDGQLAAVDSELDELRAERCKLMIELCSRGCERQDDGSFIYNIDDGEFWFHESGRLIPSDEAPGFGCPK